MTTIGVFAAIFDAENRILCVKRAYGYKDWTTPGGRMDAGETPEHALVREVAEETGFIVIPGRVFGLYSKPDQDDLVISIEAKIIGRNPWQSNEEISACVFFGKEELPQPMYHGTLVRIKDAFEGKVGILRTIFDLKADL